MKRLMKLNSVIPKAIKAVINWIVSIKSLFDFILCVQSIGSTAPSLMVDFLHINSTEFDGIFPLIQATIFLLNH